MQTIEIHGSIIVLAHVVSFKTGKQDVGDGEKIEVLEIRLSNGEKISVAGNERERVHSQLREAFGTR